MTREKPWYLLSFEEKTEKQPSISRIAGIEEKKYQPCISRTALQEYQDRLCSDINMKLSIYFRPEWYVPCARYMPSKDKDVRAAVPG